MTKKNIILSGTLILIALFAVGCLVSGTFVIVENFEFSFVSGFYADAVDLTDNEDWADHRDNLDKVEVVGFEVWVTNNSSNDFSFWAYMDDYDNACQNQTCADNRTTKFLILDTLTIPASTGSSSYKLVSYAQSFNYIQNLDKIKKMVFDGSFNFYGYSSDGGASGTVDSIKAIITVNASDT